MNKSYIIDLINTLPTGTIQLSNASYYLTINPNKLKDKSIYTIDNNIETSEQYKFYEYIASGSYNQVHIVKDTKTGNKYAYRSNIYMIYDETQSAYSYLEYFIHWKLKDEIGVLKPYRMFNTEQYVNGIFELMDGTLRDILIKDKITTVVKIDIWIDCVRKLINILQNLQKKYKFVHNDFKTTNIFFKFKNSTKFEPDNLEWFIGDFDFARIVLDDTIVFGNFVHNKENSMKYNPRIDLFILVNSTYNDLNNIIANQILWSKIPIEKNKSFQKLYRTKYDNIPEIFEPSNFLNLIKEF